MDVGKIISIAKPVMKHFEACVLEPYDDGYGFMTIGFGHLIQEGEYFGDSISQQQADEILQEDIAIAINAIANSLNQECLRKLQPHQYASLLSLVFNIGLGNFKASGLRSELNILDFRMAVEEFPKWRRSNKVISAGLVRRRACEALLFDKGVVDFYAVDKYPQYVY